MNYGSLITAVLPVFCLLGLGFFLRRIAWLKPEADESILKLNLYLLYPSLILSNVIGNPALDDTRNLLLAPSVGFLTVLLGFATAYLIGPLFGLHLGKGRRTFAFSVGLFNYGFIPIPIIIALFQPAREILAVLFLFNVGVELAFWTCGILLLTGKMTRESLLRIFNPPVCAMALAMLLHFTGGDVLLPAFLSKLFEMLGACTVPMAIMSTGAILCDELKWPRIKSLPHVALAAVLLRLGLIPLAFLLIARFLPASEELKRVIVIQAAMPAAIFPIVVVRHFRGETRLTVVVVLVTTLASIVTLPLWLKYGFQFANLP